MTKARLKQEFLIWYLAKIYEIEIWNSIHNIAKKIIGREAFPSEIRKIANTLLTNKIYDKESQAQFIRKYWELEFNGGHR